ncbi:hypothetical protein [Moorena sp. SIO3I6]|nr:hypothetical protein [Moorena sp. SIO3I6]
MGCGVWGDWTCLPFPPYSLLPTPYSLKPRTLFRTELITVITAY